MEDPHLIFHKSSFDFRSGAGDSCAQTPQIPHLYLLSQPPPPQKSFNNKEPLYKIYFFK